MVAPTPRVGGPVPSAAVGPSRSAAASVSDPGSGGSPPASPSRRARGPRPAARPSAPRRCSRPARWPRPRVAFRRSMLVADVVEAGHPVLVEVRARRGRPTAPRASGPRLDLDPASTGSDALAPMRSRYARSPAIRVASRRSAHRRTSSGCEAIRAVRLLAHPDHLRARRRGRRAALRAATRRRRRRLVRGPPGRGRPHAARPPLARRHPPPTCSPTAGTRAPRSTSTAAAAWWVRDGVVWFTDWADQRLYRLAPRRSTGAVHPGAGRPRGDRYADGDVVPGRHVDRLRARAARRTAPPTDVRNEIVRLDARAPSEPEVLVTGPDFVAAPRLGPDGDDAGLAAVEPPVDAVGRHRADGPRPRHRRGDRGGGRARRVGVRAALAPRRLAVVRLRPDRLVEPLPLDARARTSRPSSGPTPRSACPAWAFGSGTLRRAGRRARGVRTPPGGVRRASRVRGPDGAAHRSGRPVLRGQRGARGGAGTVVVVAGSPTAEPGVYRGGRRDGRGATALRPPRDLGLDPRLPVGARARLVPLGRRRRHPAHRARPVLPPANPDVHGPGRRAARRCW